ncbi:hypothetical protein [Mucilaginibacter panaciglaebae]
MKKLLLATSIVLILSTLSKAQNVKEVPPDSISYSGALYQKISAKPKYPRVVGYLGFILPLETLQEGHLTPNFDHHTTKIGFPAGVNVLYSDHFGFSYEFVPTITAAGGTSKMSNLLFHPGTMFRFDHGFAIITRLAFETSGRYGFTPVFNQVFAHTKAVNYFVSAALPNRWGNADKYSLGLSLQFGFSFN